MNVGIGIVAAQLLCLIIEKVGSGQSNLSVGGGGGGG
jgi:hypothetical protein